uniref:VASP_tetra domain-containing protein n=1 Tax=Globodera pallida TaxID=36090 RepID=A0A183C4W3_GLOPA
MQLPQPSNSNGSMVQLQQQKTSPLTSVRPPPPPPRKHQSSFADKLKGVKLRKSSTGNGVPKRTVSSSSVGSSNGSASVSSKFQSQDLISELFDRLSKRKMTVEASTSANGTQNHLNAQQTLPVNDVKGASIGASYERIPSVPSLSSQDDANVGGITVGTVSAIQPTILHVNDVESKKPVGFVVASYGNSSDVTADSSFRSVDGTTETVGIVIVSDAPSSPNKETNSQMPAEHNNNVNDETRATAPITPDDLDRMKAELIEQFAKELQNLKRELTQTIRDERSEITGPAAYFK